MKELVEVGIRVLFVDDPTDRAVLLLTDELMGWRVVPIAIGADEAIAIAIGLAAVDVPRPLMHDVFVRALEAADGTVSDVEVLGQGHGNLHAELEITFADRVVRIDARTSDCIALALRVGVAIRIDRQLFDRVSITMGDSEDQTGGGRADEIVADFRSFLDGVEADDFDGGGASR